MDFSITFSRGRKLISLCHERPMEQSDLLDVHPDILAASIRTQYDAIVDSIVKDTEAEQQQQQQESPQSSAATTTERPHEPTAATASQTSNSSALNGSTKGTDRRDRNTNGDWVRRDVSRFTLFRLIVRLNANNLIAGLIIAVLRLAGMFLQIFSMWHILRYVRGTSIDDRIGIQIMFSLLLGLGAYLQSLGQHNVFHESWQAGARARSMMSMLVFEKMLKQTPLHSGSSAKSSQPPAAAVTEAAGSSDSKKDDPATQNGGESSNVSNSSMTATPSGGRAAALTTVTSISSGQLLNLVSTDSNALVEACGVIIFLLSAFFETLGAIFWSYYFTGWSFAVTLGLLLLLLPFQLSVGEQVGKVRFRAFQFSDRRIRAVSEFLAGISVVKMCGWEDNVEDLIRRLRDQESNFIFHGSLLKLINLTMFFVIPGLLSLVQFGVKMVYDTTMDPIDTFVTVALLQVIARTYQMIPRVTTCLGNGFSALSRIESYLHSDLDKDLAVVEEVGPGEDVVMEGAFGWRGFLLEDVSFTAASKGSLTVVMGSVGCGKSTLLHALMGNCAAVGPYRLQRPKKIAYVPQEAWIRDGTVRSNILLGQPMDEGRYRDVLYACGLEDDLLQWGGDDVEVGERGVTLSGGQKQRLSMARACYADADVYLLDDPISAVDARVAYHLLTVCLKGYLKNKAVILATHHPAPMRFADQVILLGNGHQLACGKADEVLSMMSPTTIVAAASSSSEQQVDGVDMHLGEDGSAAEGATTTTTSATTGGFARPPRPEIDQLMGKGRQLVFAEANAMGSVNAEVYKSYVASSGCIGAVFLILLVLGQAVRNGGEWWFTAWTRYRYDDLVPRDYVLIEMGFVIVTIIIGVIRVLLYSQVMVRNNTFVHNQMLSHVLRSPLHFFESVPLGRIVNRFSKDVDTADDALTRTAFDFLQLITVAIGSLVLVILSVYWFAIVIAVFLIIFPFLLRYYLPSTRYLKRIDASSRSPGIQLFQSTMAGLPVIRAFGLEADIRHRFLLSLDETTKAIVTSDTCQRWVGVRMDWMTVVWVVAVALLVVGLHESLGASVSGLAISQSLMLTGILQYSVRMAADTESFMTSVERIVEYGTLPTEMSTGDSNGDGKNSTTAAVTVPSGVWPSSGQIEVKGLTVAHVSNPTEAVLRDVTFTANPGEKIAIVGRTGAGKSTLLSAFFRLLPVPENTIFIDGVALSSLPLSYLRSHLGVIPQAPTLFHGSLRYNLDPFNQYTDEELYRALRSVQMEDVVAARGLRGNVGEAGSTLSVGQKQLLCAARALLGGPKVLFMDEATANVDEATDEALQKVIREACRDVTVLTIAHRLNTIMDYDKVLVLHRGVLVEMGPPQELAAKDPEDPANVFAGMVAAMNASS